MKILWVSASAIGPASRILGMNYSGSSGVWIQTVYEELLENNAIELSFLCFSKLLKSNDIVHRYSEEGEAFCLRMPHVSLGRSIPKPLMNKIINIINELKPDIIHIWGTETCVQNAVSYCAPNIPKVVFLQGLIGIHDRYHNVDMKKHGILYKKTLLEELRGRVHDYLFHRQIQFEADQIRRCGNVLVDNLFSTAYCKSICNNIRVHEYCLKPAKVFEEQQWSLTSCERHSVFTVYGPSQDKGLHQLLRAISIVKRSISDIKVYIPGKYHIDKCNNHLSNSGLTSYEKFLANIIKNSGLENNVFFCGQLSQVKIAERLRNAHVFVNPSIMEVHAGSLREAMLVGVPSISTYCGSVGEYIKEMENGLLYRYEEFEVLAYKITLLMKNPELCKKISIASRCECMKSRYANKKSLYDIYNEIIRDR